MSCLFRLGCLTIILIGAIILIVLYLRGDIRVPSFG